MCPSNPTAETIKEWCLHFLKTLRVWLMFISEIFKVIWEKWWLMSVYYIMEQILKVLSKKQIFYQDFQHYFELGGSSNGWKILRQNNEFWKKQKHSLLNFFSFLKDLKQIVPWFSTPCSYWKPSVFWNSNCRHDGNLMENVYFPVTDALNTRTLLCK